jgi:hypothetical protein
VNKIKERKKERKKATKKRGLTAEDAEAEAQRTRRIEWRCYGKWNKAKKGTRGHGSAVSLRKKLF